MLVEDRQLARANTQTSAAIRAAELIGNELGMFIDRREQGKPGDYHEILDAIEGANRVQGVAPGSKAP